METAQLRNPQVIHTKAAKVKLMTRAPGRIENANGIARESEAKA